MAFKYHKPTRSSCPICEMLEQTIKDTPIVTTFEGKASSANNFPFHNWYNFVLGYSPDFPSYIINKYKISDKHVILDPFMGTATTNVVAKSCGIRSYGVEANDYFIDIANAKLTWDLNYNLLKEKYDNLLSLIKSRINEINFCTDELSLFKDNNFSTSYDEILKSRPKELSSRYISDKPYVKLKIISDAINEHIDRNDFGVYNFFRTAFSSIIVPCSNVSYGPGFGVKKAKEDYDVVEAFVRKVTRMLDDIYSVQNSPLKTTEFKIVHGDSRHLTNYFEDNSIDFLITSPPYPGDHEYTKHTKLELMFEKDVLSHQDFRIIKKRMLTGSTTNIYKENNDKIFVENNELIEKVTTEIQKRLDEDNATSGFEKLYTKLVWEYFGGMAQVLKEALRIMKPGGKFSLLVSDSHAFKMVHIRTAEILLDIALKVGYSSGQIDLWQNKRSTSHKYNLREEILTITK